MLIKGNVSWYHGLNPVRKQPLTATVHLMSGNCEVASQTINANEFWAWLFQVPETVVEEHGYWIRLDVPDDYQCYEEGRCGFISIHKSVVLNGAGIPTGRFYSNHEEKHPRVVDHSILLSSSNGLWLNHK